MRRVFVSLALGAALFLPSTALGADTIDQAQEVVSCSVGFASPSVIAQTFVAGRSGSLVAVAIWQSGGALAGGKAGIAVEIRDASGGVPGATVLASAQVKTNVFNKWVKVSFRTPASVTQGTQYALVIRSGTETYVAFNCAQHDIYASGDAQFTFDYVTWSTFTGEDTLPLDLTFRTYVN